MERLYSSTLTRPSSMPPRTIHHTPRAMKNMSRKSPQFSAVLSSMSRQPMPAKMSARPAMSEAENCRRAAARSSSV